MNRRHVQTVTALACAAVAGLAGCMGIPTAGPVQSGEVVLPEPDAVIPIPTGPREGATPEDIVNGFLAAAAVGVYDDYRTAREFLSDAANKEWAPWASTTVYGTQDPDVLVVEEEGSAAVTVEPVASVDDAGRYLESAVGAPVQLELTLAERGGDWRITGVPDGVLMSYTEFQSSHREVNVYFASHDGQVLVPEVRWFQESKILEAAAHAIVDGPSPWLRDGVRTGVPDGVTLPLAGVTVDSADVLTINLASDLAGAPEVEDRNLLQAQLVATFGGTPAVISDIRVTLNGRPWEPTSAPRPQIDPAPSSGPYVLAAGPDGGWALSEVIEGEIVPVADAAPLVGLEPSSPAVAMDSSVRVVLDNRQRLVLLPPEAAPPTVLLEGAALLPPSVDRHGWVWTSEQLNPGVLTVVSAAGDDPVPLAADWLAGRDVRSVRVSRDGARVAVAYQSADGPSVIEVTSVVRDQEGRPQGLGSERLVVGASLQDVAELTWLDETTLGVLGAGAAAGAPTAYEVPLGGRTFSKVLLAGAVDIAAMPERIYLADEKGVLHRLNQASTWTVVTDGVRDPAFPG